jgi:hypothetical protein
LEDKIGTAEFLIPLSVLPTLSIDYTQLTIVIKSTTLISTDLNIITSLCDHFHVSQNS